MYKVIGDFLCRKHRKHRDDDFDDDDAEEEHEKFVFNFAFLVTSKLKKKLSNLYFPLVGNRATENGTIKGPEGRCVVEVPGVGL